MNVGQEWRFSALAEGPLTNVGMVQDLHYSDFSEELKENKIQQLFLKIWKFSNMNKCVGQVYVYKSKQTNLNEVDTVF